MTRTALVTGVAGQDGILLARSLLADGYAVVGTTVAGAEPARPYLEGVRVVEQDLRDTASVRRLVEESRPDEVYNVAALSSVRECEERPDLAMAVNAGAVEGLIDVLQAVAPDARFFQASSSEVFGPGAPDPQDESTPHAPRGVYAESKRRAHEVTVAARERGLFACVGILYNHESPLRPPGFVTRKITQAVAEIAAGRRDRLVLGNLDVSRDWGSAVDVVRAVRAAVAHDEPGDYVVATGVLHTVAQLVEAAADAAGVGDVWSHVDQDPALVRRDEAPGNRGDASRARDVLGWTPRSDFAEVVAAMVAADERRLATGVEESVEYLWEADADA